MAKLFDGDSQVDAKDQEIIAGIEWIEYAVPRMGTPTKAELGPLISQADDVRITALIN
jgi:hypothetical protein